MFGFLKNLIGERGATPEEKQPSAPPSGTPPAHEAPPVETAPSPASGGESEPILPKKSSGSLSEPRPATKHSGRVLLHLKAITDRFLPALKGTLATPPEANTQISLKLDDLLPQLSSGRVEITLAELRRVAPVGTFVDDTSLDHELVSIPLNELLPRIDNNLLKTQSQQRVEVPNDIETPFRKQGGATTKIVKPAAKAEESERPADRQIAPGIAPSSELKELFAHKKSEEKPAPQAETATPAPAPVDPIIPPAPERVQPPREEKATVELSPIKLTLSPSASQTLSGAAPTPAAPPRRSPVADPAPTPDPEPEGEPIPLRTVSLMENLSSPPVRPVAPVAPVAPGATSSSAPRSTAPIQLSPTPAPVAPPAASARSGSGSTISIPLSAVSKAWPEAIREELAGADPGAVIEFPKADLEAALKLGKVALQWARLRCWVRPAVASGGSSLYDDAIVELPLPIVAPLFMAAATPGQAAKKITVDESMPALFQPAKPAAAAEAVASPAVTNDPRAATAATTGAGAVGMNGRIPSVLVERACALRGVAGAVVALPDGLLVSASVPDEFSAETIAAFLPQVFSRLEQAAGTMKIGDVQHLSFTAGERAWQIWRAGDLLFAAIGTPNEMLPGAQLKIIAGQLARQTKG